MKALKKKWDEGYKKTYEIIQKLQKNKNHKPKMEEIDYNHLGSSTISFEKIPLLKVDHTRNRIEDLTAETSYISKEEIKNGKKNSATNTGPDVLFMLKDIKQSRLGKELRELYKMDNLNSVHNQELPDRFTTFSPKSAYKSKKKSITRNINSSFNSESQALETQSLNPYGNRPQKLERGNTGSRYKTAKKKPKSYSSEKSSPKMDKFDRYRLENLDRLENEMKNKNKSKKKVPLSRLSYQDAGKY